MKASDLREHTHNSVTEAIHAGDIYNVFRLLSCYNAAVRAELLLIHPDKIDPLGLCEIDQDENLNAIPD